MSSALVGLEREGGERVREGDVDACYVLRTHVCV